MKVQKAVIIISVAGLLLSLLVFLTERQKGSEEAEILIRNTNGEGDERLVLIASSDMGEEEIEFHLEELEGEEEIAEESEELFGEGVELPSNEESFRESLVNCLTEKEAESRREVNFYLPKYVDGHEVSWALKKKRKAPLILGMTVVVTAMSYFIPKEKKEKQKKERLKRMKEEYPNFAFRFSMLLSSGLTTRQVWERLLSHYEKNASKDIFCDEVRITCLELRNGISEVKAYENLSGRCGIKEMTRFCGLLSQGIRRGSKELAERIREEARSTLKTLSDELRMENEMIGTKLLLPTMVLLLIVMVIVMLPAFSML